MVTLVSIPMFGTSLSDQLCSVVSETIVEDVVYSFHLGLLDVG